MIMIWDSPTVKRIFMQHRFLFDDFSIFPVAKTLKHYYFISNIYISVKIEHYEYFKNGHTIVRNFERNAKGNLLKGHFEVRLFGTWTLNLFQQCNLVLYSAAQMNLWPSYALYTYDVHYYSTSYAFGVIFLWTKSIGFKMPPHTRSTATLRKEVEVWHNNISM